MSNRQIRKVFGLIGRNVDYSWSPLIHGTAFAALGLPCAYTIFNIREPALVGDALRGARALGIAGFNVTIPYKQAVVEFLDELSPEAAAIRAVNTIVNDHGRLCGHNTDIDGFAAPLLGWRERISGSRVCIFGNGGAALAAIEAFRRHFSPAAIMLFARNPAKAAELLRDYRHRDLVVPLPMSGLEEPEGAGLLSGCSVVVNATPIGTAGRDDAQPSVVPEGARLFRPGQIVYDMVYNPLETPLLADARAAGAETVPGMEMLIGQAARSFHIWTGLEMPVATVRAAVMDEIARQGRLST